MGHPRNEHATAREMPGLSPAEDDRLEARAERLEQQEASDAIQHAQNWRATTAERCNARVTEVRGLTEQAWGLRASLQSRETTVKRGAEQIQALKKQYAALVSLAEGLAREVADQDTILAEPNAYIEHLYERYPALQRDRPSIFD